MQMQSDKHIIINLHERIQFVMYLCTIFQNSEKNFQVNNNSKYLGT